LTFDQALTDRGRMRAIRKTDWNPQSKVPNSSDQSLE